MNWIKDCKGFLINLERVEKITFDTLKDTKIGKIIAYEFYIRFVSGKYESLGFIVNDITLDEIMEIIIENRINFTFLNLNEVITDHLLSIKEIDQKTQIDYILLQIENNRYIIV